ncbi:cationic trypsin-3-like [Lampris incognitus]|uniref:cationic trypsin-3-like n=1 Tax=Lampris incognitus TaxID=2546036 RepID=UPI0024B5AE11|nr:cationic trypsin-3-like [Lampris incognitus]
MAWLVLLLLSLWADVTLGGVEKRIIGGRNCGENERKFHVLLREDGEFVCGGSLISDKWVLTAAHCWPNVGSLEAEPGVHPSGGTRQKIAEHKIYMEGTNKHDIMLLKLSTAVTGIATVDLPDCTKSVVPDPKNPQTSGGVKVQIAGYANYVGKPGDVEEDIPEHLPATLQCADMETVACADTPINGFMRRLFCGKTSGGVDICVGDSGGGVVYDKKIYGVISGSGEVICGIPVRFMDVCKYLNWIKTTIQG